MTDKELKAILQKVENLQKQAEGVGKKLSFKDALTLLQQKKTPSLHARDDAVDLANQVGDRLKDLGVKFGQGLYDTAADISDLLSNMAHRKR